MARNFKAKVSLGAMWREQTLIGPAGAESSMLTAFSVVFLGVLTVEVIALRRSATPLKKNAPPLENRA